MLGSDGTVESLGTIFVDPAAYADPVSWHKKAARIRAEAPILKVDVEGFPTFWAVTTHADLLEIERNPEIFTNSPAQVLTRQSASFESENPAVKTLIQMDGEEHHAHRAVVNDWFRPGGIKKLAARIDQLACDSVDHMSSLGGRCDFMKDVAVHYPLKVIMAILGLPEGDYPRMLELTQELFGAEDPDIARVGEDQSILEVVADFLHYFSDLNSDRRANPKDDLASVIAGARIDGKPLPDMDTFGYYLIIATAGHDTTSNVIGGALLALLDFPDQLELLRAEPELTPQAAEEFIRYVAPVKHFLRTCTRRFTVREVTFEPGDLILLSFASATRDESVFNDANRLDVRRVSESNHLGFGFGRHFCLGAHLARLEIRSFYRELLGRLEHIELAGDPSWVRANFVQGPKSIPVAYSLTEVAPS
ncbi:MAG TPA: cytochrome P450 [Acidimicrobiales bacterium]